MSRERDDEKSSPRITHISWGRMEVEGLGAGRDFKLYPGGGRAWDWNETGTHHVPGIQPAHVQELLDHGSSIIILSRGMQLALQTCPETLRLLRDQCIQYHVEEPQRQSSITTGWLKLSRLGVCFTPLAKAVS